jgi:hypothetical protein
VASVPDVAATLFAPVAFNPDGAPVWRTAVGAVDPDVGVPVPAVVAGDPDKALAGGGHDLDGTRGRRTDADHYLRIGCSNREEEGTGGGKKLFLHLFVLLMNCS